MEFPIAETPCWCFSSAEESLHYTLRILHIFEAGPYIGRNLVGVCFSSENGLRCQVSLCSLRVG
jgi:hypothetical protein